MKFFKSIISEFRLGNHFCCVEVFKNTINIRFCCLNEVGSALRREDFIWINIVKYSHLSFGNEN